MLKHFCPWPNCREVIPMGQRYCEKHMAQYMQSKERREKQRQAKYNRDVRYTRDKSLHDFYNSPEWSQLKQSLINKYHGLCVYSYIVKHQIIRADEYHHIEPIREAWDKRLDADNIIPLSASVHHGVVAQMYKEDKAKAQNYLRNLLWQWNEWNSGGT